MNRQRILNLYNWQPGTCFRHPDLGDVETTPVKIIHPRHGGREVVRACRDCVLDMEEQRRGAAEMAGLPYGPGHAGEDLMGS